MPSRSVWVFSHVIWGPCTLAVCSGRVLHSLCALEIIPSAYIGLRSAVLRIMIAASLADFSNVVTLAGLINSMEFKISVEGGDEYSSLVLSASNLMLITAGSVRP